MTSKHTAAGQVGKVIHLFTDAQKAVKQVFRQINTKLSLMTSSWKGKETLCCFSCLLIMSSEAYSVMEVGRLNVGHGCNKKGCSHGQMHT